MKHIIKKPIIYTFVLFLSILLMPSCNDNETFIEPEDEYETSVKPVSDLMAEATTKLEEIKVSWKNPENKDVVKAEVSYTIQGVKTKTSPTPLLVNVQPEQASTVTITVPKYSDYKIGVSAINKAGSRSTAVYVNASPLKPEEDNTWKDVNKVPRFLQIADSLMKTLVVTHLDGMPRDIWSGGYPRGGQYWDGAAMIWGHGSIFSGYANLREAATGIEGYQDKIRNLYDDRLLTGIDKFRNTKNGRKEAYAVWPGDGDERYYDDNVWVGLDMVDLYMATKNAKYLDRAKIVWNFILVGYDDAMGGGVYWKEDAWSKHTCSTAPSAVLAAKLYLATKEPQYLDAAKDLYHWCKDNLQDPSDYIYWDNIRYNTDHDPSSGTSVSKAKYTYNSGQPMQAAVLLYNITKEAQYLTDAQNIAKAVSKKWFSPLYSTILHESFMAPKEDHVWFWAITLRGFLELYKVDGNREYVTAFEKTMLHAWSKARSPLGLMYINFRSGNASSDFDILHQGAFLEMFSRLAILERDGM